MRIAVLLGGISEERDVSLASGAEVARALRSAGHEVVAVDSAHGVLGPADEQAILSSGVGRAAPDMERTDLVGTGDGGAISRIPEVRQAAVLFLALHGGAGEDGTLQGMLDLAGVTYVGSGRVGCTLSMDKDVTKRLLRDAQIPTADWITGYAKPDVVVDRLGLPVIVKPVSGGSTVGLTLVREAAELDAAYERARSVDERVMYEAFVKGREFTVGILGDEALPVGEIIPEHEIFDYECKYQDGMAQEIFPADIPAEAAAYMQQLALKTHEVLQLRDFSRVDFILDQQGIAWCLEANALPGLTAASLLPKAAAAAGISFPDLCERIVVMAEERGSVVP
jgi:D-alanine-D-alanine ligase